jgi:CRP/FNR family transcriptional regulator, cyclic AMP receptor protein
MESLDRLVAEHDFFKGLEQPYLDLITGCAKNVHFKSNTFIFREGEPADLFFLIRHGKVAIEIASPDRGAIVIQTLGPGDVLGWSWLVPPFRWQLDSRAIEDVRAVAIDGACLRGKCEQDTNFGFELMKRFAQVIIRRLQATRVQLLDVYGHATAR